MQKKISLNYDQLLSLCIKMEINWLVIHQLNSQTIAIYAVAKGKLNQEIGLFILAKYIGETKEKQTADILNEFELGFGKAF